MNRQNGLLAFGCTLVVVVAVLFQIPVVSGIGDVGKLVAGPSATTEPTHPLALALTPPTAAQIPAGPGGVEPLTLFQLQREQRVDPLLRELAAAQRLPFAVLKAHLAQASQGVLGEDGSYWARLAEGEDEVTDEGAARTRAAAALLGTYRQQTGSVEGALMAWQIGPYRASRVSADAGGHLELALDNLRTHLLAPQREAAERWLCTVLGLAATLKARWPVRDGDVTVREGFGVRLAASPGEAIASPMAGTVGYTGVDGNRGQCVEVIHACSLRTEVCKVAKPLVAPGKRVQAGTPIARAAKIRPRFNLWLGATPLDAAQLMPPEEAFPGTAPKPDVQSEKLETIQMGEPDPDSPPEQP